MDLAKKILNGLSISKPQRKFLLTLFTTILVLRQDLNCGHWPLQFTHKVSLDKALVVRGKVNFRNLSRYSDLSEKTYSRQFAKAFDAISFN